MVKHRSTLMNLSDGKIIVHILSKGEENISYLNEFRFGLLCLWVWFYPVVIFQDQKIPKTTGRLSK